MAVGPPSIFTEDHICEDCVMQAEAVFIRIGNGEVYVVACKYHIYQLTRMIAGYRALYKDHQLVLPFSE